MEWIWVSTEEREGRSCDWMIFRMVSSDWWKGLIPSVCIHLHSVSEVPKHQSVFVAPLSAIRIMTRIDINEIRHKRLSVTAVIDCLLCLI